MRAIRRVYGQFGTSAFQYVGASLRFASLRFASLRFASLRSLARPLVALLALAASVSLSCNVFDPRTNGLRCTAPADCDSTRTCEMGFCILRPELLPDADLSETDPPDADLTLPDADLTLPDAAPQTGDCTTCSGGTCSDSCSGVDCALACPVAACNCDLACTSAAAICAAVCHPNTVCSLDCQGAPDCRLTCNDNSVCEQDCTGIASCDKSKCVDGASCLINCTGSTTCLFKQCDGGETSCANDILVCNRACP